MLKFFLNKILLHLIRGAYIVFPGNTQNIIIIIIIIIITIIISFMQSIYTYFLRQTMSLGNTVFQIFFITIYGAYIASSCVGSIVLLR